MIDIHEIRDNWNIIDKSMNFANNIIPGKDNLSFPILSINSLKDGTNIEVTDSLQRWINGSKNYGWIFIPRSKSYLNIRSPKWEGAVERPMLTVIYEATKNEFNEGKLTNSETFY